MSEQLDIDIRLGFAEFTLQVVASVPLQGITALSGPSASGKTTLLRVLAGLERRAQGSVRFAGVDWTGLPPHARGVGYVFQDARLFPHLTVAQNLNYGAERRGTPEARVKAVVEALDLGPILARRPERLSGGEARRVALGRALASGPRILLMDEPLTGLDRARKADLVPYIARAVAAFDVPALYVTHSAMEITHLADRVLLIENGALQGWLPAAPRLAGRVVGVSDEKVRLDLGGRQITVPGRAELSEIWAVAIPQEAVISTADPGITGAALTLEAVVTGNEPGHVSCDFAGQALRLPWQGAPLIKGQPVWLILPQLAGRPIQPAR